MSGESSQPWQAKHTASRLQRTTTMTRPSVVLAASGPLCVIVDTWNTKRQTFEQQASSRKRRGGRSGRQAKPPQKSSKEYAIGGPRFAMGMRSGPSLFLPTVKSRDFVQKPLGETLFRSLSKFARPEREASESVPVTHWQALREESTHGRPRAFVGRSCQVYAGFQPPSREAGTTCSHAAYMRCIRPIEVHEVPLNYHEAVAYGICTSQP